MSDQQKYSQKLKGTRILVIGGTSGIGYAVAEASVDYGAAAVIVSSSNEDRVKGTVSRLKHEYPSATCEISGHVCNLSDQDALDDNVKALLEAATANGTQKLDHIVHSAGDRLSTRGIQSIDMKMVIAAGMVRFFSPLMLAKHAPKYLNPGPASSITLTTGAVSQKPIPNWSAIASYATGLHGMTRNLALDLKPIRVNLISPGAVDTELWDSLPQDVREAQFKNMQEKLATGRVGMPEDVAEAYIYCMKDHNTTGTVIDSNGGSLIT